MKKIAEIEKLAKERMNTKKAPMSKKAKETPANLYLPRNDNDYGLDHEVSEDSGCDDPPTPDKRVPTWVKGNINNVLL